MCACVLVGGPYGGLLALSRIVMMDGGSRRRRAGFRKLRDMAGDKTKENEKALSAHQRSSSDSYDLVTHPWLLLATGFKPL